MLNLFFLFLRIWVLLVFLSKLNERKIFRKKEFFRGIFIFNVCFIFYYEIGFFVKDFYLELDRWG